MYRYNEELKTREDVTRDQQLKHQVNGPKNYYLMFLFH